MEVTKSQFGTTKDGTEIEQYQLVNRHGLKASIITLGATVTSVEAPDRENKFANVTLSFSDLAGYEKNAPYFGGICGRYANRIAGGKFTLDDEEYSVTANEGGKNLLHGGAVGFNGKVWTAESVQGDGFVGVILEYVSPDGEEGFPGTLTTTVTYKLTEENELRIEYTATTDKPTVLNLTNHCYWNLGGAGSGDVLEHQVTLYCDKYLPVDENAIPTGDLSTVADTPFDFRKLKAIGAEIRAVGMGYDHCYVLSEPDEKNPAFVARVVDSRSSRVMEIFTTEPGIQFYTGNFLQGNDETGGFGKHEAFCLEAQHYPDSPNQSNFPSTVLKPGEAYRQTTVHKFSVDK